MEAGDKHTVKTKKKLRKRMLEVVKTPKFRKQMLLLQFKKRFAKRRKMFKGVAS